MPDVTINTLSNQKGGVDGWVFRDTITLMGEQENGVSAAEREREILACRKEGGRGGRREGGCGESTGVWKSGLDGSRTKKCVARR